MRFFSLQYIFCSDNVKERDYDETDIKESNQQSDCEKIYHNTLKEFFENFVNISRLYNNRFTNNQFYRALNIMNLYPSKYEKNFSIPFLEHLRYGKRRYKTFEKIFGHDILITKRTKSLSKKSFHLKEGITLNRILRIVKSMTILRNYNYSCIFYNVRNNDLLYSISLMSLVEIMGVIYLRLLSEISYYKTDLFYIRDFVTHSVVFLHSINVIHNMSLKDELIKKVFKIFAVKNLKIICIFKHMWKLSYELILERKENNFKNFVSHDVAPKFEDIKKIRNGGISLVEFNSEISLLFEFISQINLNLKFKKDFELLRITKKYDYGNSEEFIMDFDQEGLLKFYTEEYENNFLTVGHSRYKEPSYFLNSLYVENSAPNSFIHDVKITSLLFIKNEDIKRYFSSMWNDAYLNDDCRYRSDTFQTLQKTKTIEIQPKKKQKLVFSSHSMQHSKSNIEQNNDVHFSSNTLGVVTNLSETTIPSSFEVSCINPEWALYDQEFLNFLFKNF